MGLFGKSKKERETEYMSRLDVPSCLCPLACRQHNRAFFHIINPHYLCIDCGPGTPSRPPRDAGAAGPPCIAYRFAAILCRRRAARNPP